MHTLRRKAEPLGFAPDPDELGQRVAAEICKDCWAEWQKKQMQLINHFGLDVSNPDSHTFPLRQYEDLPL